MCYNTSGLEIKYIPLYQMGSELISHITRNTFFPKILNSILYKMVDNKKNKCTTPTMTLFSTLELIFLSMIGLLCLF